LEGGYMRIELKDKLEEKFNDFLPPGVEPKDFMNQLLEEHKDKMMVFEEPKKEIVQEQEVETAPEVKVRKLTEEEIKALKDQEDLYWKRYRLETKEAMTEAFDILFSEKKPKEATEHVAEPTEDLAVTPVAKKPKRRWPF